MLSYHSCFIYGTWRSNIGLGKILKSSYEGGGGQTTKGLDHFLWGELSP